VKSLRANQGGAVLVVSLILLVLVTLFALASINMSTVNLRMTTNSQVKSEAIAAAQSAIEVVVSTDFPANPQAKSMNVAIPNNTTTTYPVTVAAPECKNAQTLKMVELDVSQVDDVACFVSAAAANPGIAGASNAGDSVCASRQWEVAATISDGAGLGAAVTVHQGIGQRVPVGSTC
jgi:Tfp pilus assembly protein PilX